MPSNKSEQQLWLHRVATPRELGIIRQRRSPSVAMTSIALPPPCEDFLQSLDYETHFANNPNLIRIAEGYSQLNQQISGWHAEPDNSGEARFAFATAVSRFFPRHETRPLLAMALAEKVAEATAGFNRQSMVFELRVCGPSYDASRLGMHYDVEEDATLAIYLKGKGGVVMAPSGDTTLPPLAPDEARIAMAENPTKAQRYRQLPGKIMAAWPRRQRHSGSVHTPEDGTRIAIFGFASRLTPEPAL